jgi:hypothetical protein
MNSGNTKKPWSSDTYEKSQMLFSAENQICPQKSV